jgi:hypothetical protein
MKAANGIVTLAKEAESESVQLRAWRAILADQMAVCKFSDLEYRMAESKSSGILRVCEARREDRLTV